MSKKTMFGMLRRKYASLISPLYTWCSCISVKDDELHDQTWAGRQVPSHQGLHDWELVPATSPACSAAKTEPNSPGHKSSATHKIVSLVAASDKHVQGSQATPCPETIDIIPEATCNHGSTSKPAAEPPTPLQLSPEASRKLSQTSLDSQDSQLKLTASAETSGKPAAKAIESPTSSSIDSDSSSATTTNTNNNNDSTNSVSTSKLSYGVATALNQRQHQEDRATAAVVNNSEHRREFKRMGVAAVFDGHGGSETAEYLQQHFVPLLLQQLQLGTSPQEATAAAAQQIEAHLLSGNCIAGSTLTAVVVIDDYLVVAQIGDSRAVLCRGEGKPLQLTPEHKPSDANERARIMAADPLADITTDGYCYGMGVSRGLGSSHIKSDASKQAFTATVDVTVHALQSTDDFIVLGSDGLFDSLQNQEVFTTARRALAAAPGDCSAAAQVLVDRAIAMGSSDNVTAVVMLLHDRKIQLAKSNSRLFRNRDSC